WECAASGSPRCGWCGTRRSSRGGGEPVARLLPDPQHVVAPGLPRLRVDLSLVFTVPDPDRGTLPVLTCGRADEEPDCAFTLVALPDETGAETLMAIPFVHTLSPAAGRAAAVRVLDRLRLEHGGEEPQSILSGSAEGGAGGLPPEAVREVRT